MKRIILPAAFLGSYLISSIFGGSARAEEPAVPKPDQAAAVKKEEPEKPKITLDAWIEDFSIVDTAGDDFHTQRIEVIDNGNDRFLRVDHTIGSDGYESERIGFRPRISIGNLFEGVAGGFGSLDNHGNHSIGAELDGTIAEAIQIGLALEKNHSNGIDSRLFQIYAGAKPAKNVTARIGYFLRDGISYFHGVGWTTIDDIFLGIGGNIGERRKGKLNACIGRCARKKGEGIGFRLWGQTDFDGNYNIDFLVTFGNNYKGFAGLMDLFDAGLNDPGIGNNIADYRAPPNYARGRNAFARFKAKHSKDGTISYCGEFYIRTDSLLGKHVNLVAGGSWSRIYVPGQDAQDTIETLLGAQLGPVTFEYYLDFGKGMKPVHMIFVGTSVRDVYDSLAGAKKK